MLAEGCKSLIRWDKFRFSAQHGHYNEEQWAEYLKMSKTVDLNISITFKKLIVRVCVCGVNSCLPPRGSLAH